MKKSAPFSILLVLCFATVLLYLWHDTAQAARFGRSRSFGSRPSYQRSAPAPAQNPTTTQAKPAPGSQTGMTTPTSSRWGGMLGGFLMGGLIGSLLFGGGHGFGGPGLMDLLLIGGGLMLLMRFLRARQMAAQPAAPASLYSGSGQSWGQSGYTPDGEPPTPPALPPGFDAEEFRKGATAIFNRLQASWDKRDLEDIRQFTSTAVFAEIQRQAQEDPHPSKTEVLMVDCRIVEVRDIDQQTVVSVLYDAMLREDGDRTAKQVRELWHFSRDARRPEDFWILEGIQQVE